MKVAKWIGEDEMQGRNVTIGGMGGWFGKNEEDWDAGHRWKDYIKNMRPECVQYAEAFRESVLERDIRYTGEEHQDASDGVPLFEDGTVGFFTYRAWGDLMAAVWSEAEDKNYSYMDFYM